MGLGHLEIHIALSNPNIDIVSLKYVSCDQSWSPQEKEVNTEKHSYSPYYYFI